MIWDQSRFYPFLYSTIRNNGIKPSSKRNKRGEKLNGNVRTVQVWMWNISGIKFTCILCLPAGEVGGEYTSKVGNREGETRERI